MDTARLARNGIVWLGTITAGAAWGEFFALKTLATVAAGALVALTALYIASFTR